MSETASANRHLSTTLATGEEVHAICPPETNRWLVESYGWSWTDQNGVLMNQMYPPEQWGWQGREFKSAADVFGFVNNEIVSGRVPGRLRATARGWCSHGVAAGLIGWPLRVIIESRLAHVTGSAWQPITGENDGYFLTADFLEPNNLQWSGVAEPTEKQHELLAQVTWH
jgi:hypothetical protein